MSSRAACARSGDRVRITAQLNDVATGSHLWAERYDRDLADVFAVQDEITEAIVATIEPQLYAAENFRAQRKAPESLDAWDLVMRALSHLLARDARGQSRRAGAARAGDRDRSELRPGACRAGGQPYVRRPYGMGGCGRAPRRRRTRRRWRRCAPTARTPGRISRSPAPTPTRGGLDDSLAEFETALRLNPNFALAQGYYGLVLVLGGRWREGAEAARRALRLSPRDPFAAIYNGVAAYAAFVERDYDGGDPAGAREHPSAQ